MRFNRKHRAKNTTVDGKKFASLGEARRYQELKMLLQAHQIVNFECQPEFLLLPSHKDEYGKTVRMRKYVGDFIVWYPDGSIVVEDVKGDILTPEFKLKWAWFGYLLKQGRYESQYPGLKRQIVHMVKK